MGDQDLELSLELSKRDQDLLNESLQIWEEDALEVGAVGYMARVLTQATIPHRHQPGNEYVRQNGSFTLSIMAPSHIGLPYGTVPRLVLNWLTTEAVKRREPVLFLGDSLSKFMRELGYDQGYSGGKRGTGTNFKNQSRKLFASSIYWSHEERRQDDSVSTADLHMQIATQHSLWWEPVNPDQQTLWQSQVTLSREFYKEITERPIPVDMRVIKALRRSPLALDLYCYLTYRFFSLRKTTVIPWEALLLQFGADYKRPRAFREAIHRQLKKVLVFYPDAHVRPSKKGLELHPSETSVKVIKG